jgi:hypothetical protein
MSQIDPFLTGFNGTQSGLSKPNPGASPELRNRRSEVRILSGALLERYAAAGSLVADVAIEASVPAA